MAKRQSTLTKACLFGLLDLYGSMTLREIGGYDTGVYFRFDGKPIDPGHVAFTGPDRKHCGRRVSPRGFESETLVHHYRRCNSIEDFFARVAARRANLERWMQEHAAGREAARTDRHD